MTLHELTECPHSLHSRLHPTDCMSPDSSYTPENPATYEIRLLGRAPRSYERYCFCAGVRC